MRVPPRADAGMLLVEIAGVAGAGKSTLAKTLCPPGDAGCRQAGPLEMRDLRHLPYVVHGLPRSLPILAANLRGEAAITWKEAKYLVYAMEWDRYLRRRPEFRHGVTFLDQGPTYVLARLGTRAEPLKGCEPQGGWWNTVVETWARTLDVVVWLDAPDRVLVERVNSREQDHEIKGRAAEVAHDFTAGYRRSFERVLDRMSELEGPTVLRYDTGEWSAEDIAAAVRGELQAIGAADGAGP